MGIRIESLGGSGENGRNCFLVQAGDTRLLLDCGVKRGRTAAGVGEYPLLTESLAQSISAVFLSHSHEDHVAALPYLRRLGFRGPVYGSPETLADVPRMLDKWSRYVLDSGGTLPYAPSDMEGFHFIPLAPGKGTLADLPIRTGRSGHVIGGLWLSIEAGARPILYSGDMCFDSPLLAVDTPPACGAAILDCAYADEIPPTVAPMYKLLDLAQEVAHRGGKVLLPLPAKGRGCEVYLTFARNFLHAPLFVETAIQTACRDLLGASAWLRPDVPKEAISADLRVIATAEERLAAQAYPGPAVYLATDGMLTTREARSYLNAFAGDRANAVILTGHAAPGTPARELFSPEGREALGARMGAESVTIKAHPDGRDVLALCRRLRPAQALLFHAERARCIGLMKALEKQGTRALCGLSPAGLSL